MVCSIGQQGKVQRLDEPVPMMCYFCYSGKILDVCSQPIPLHDIRVYENYKFHETKQIKRRGCAVFCLLRAGFQWRVDNSI